MLSILSLLALPALLVSATRTCQPPGGYTGVCIDVNRCLDGGGQYSYGHCPGQPNNILCCEHYGCNTPYGSGYCADKSQCPMAAVPGYCPGPGNIECCATVACHTPRGSGSCIDAPACHGTAVPGYCPGDANFQCCVD